MSESAPPPAPRPPPPAPAPPRARGSLAAPPPPLERTVRAGAWIVANLGWPGLPRFDPDVVKLAMAASVEAIFLSTFVLMSQNRMATLAERMGVEGACDPELPALEQDARPEAVLAKLDECEAQPEARP